MNVEEAKVADLEGIMRLVRQAQLYFKEHDIDQWQNNYPTKEVILTDIRNHENYVLRDHDQVVATMTLNFAPQAEYENIQSETWQTSATYATIHRLAVDNQSKGQGLATKMLSFAAEKCRFLKVGSLRTDTYASNFPMQTTLKRNGFVQQGIIKRPGVADMIAFEKIIK